jgi:hypothetical protein
MRKLFKWIKSLFIKPKPVPEKPLELYIIRRFKSGKILVGYGARTRIITEKQFMDTLNRLKK